MKHVVFMTFAGLSVFAYMKANPLILLGWVIAVVIVGFVTGVITDEKCQ